MAVSGCENFSGPSRNGPQARQTMSLPWTKWFWKSKLQTKDYAFTHGQMNLPWAQWACPGGACKLDRTTGTSSGKHFWLDGSSFLSQTALPGLCWVFFKCYVLGCALIVLVQGEIFDKHFMVLLATSTTKMKGEQIPQSVKEWLWILLAKYTIFP